MQIEIFTTDQLAPNHSLQGWQSYRLTPRGYTIKPQGPAPFRASLRAYTSRRYKFAEVAISSSSRVIGPRPASSTTRPILFMLSLIEEGAARILQDGRDTLVAADDIVLIDISRPLSVEATALRVRSVDISAAWMREVLPQVDGLTAIRVSSHTPAGTMLKTTVDRLFTLPASVHDGVVDHIADTIPHLLAATFTALPAAKQLVPRRTEASQRQRVLEFVSKQLADKDLSPQTVAQALDMSPRFIHKLFAGESMTLMQRVWNERLARCRNELAMASLAHCSISEIAYRWGFRHTAHFSRAFTAHFGQSPSAFRRNAVSTPPLS